MLATAPAMSLSQGRARRRSPDALGDALRLQRVLNALAKQEDAVDQFTSSTDLREGQRRTLESMVGADEVLRFDFPPAGQGTELGEGRTSGEYPTQDVQFIAGGVLMVPTGLSRLVLSVPSATVVSQHRKVGEYGAQNAYGARTRVQRYRTENWGVAVVDEAQAEKLRDAHAGVVIDGSEARAIVPRLRLKMAVRPLVENVFGRPLFTVRRSSKPTFDEPVESEHTGRYLAVRVELIEVYDPKTGRAFYRFDGNAAT